MQKKIAAFALAGAVVLGGGAAIAVPAFAESGSTSTDASTSRIDAIKNALKSLVDDKTLTQAQADKVAEKLGQPGALPGGGGHGFRGGPGGFGGAMQVELDAAAKVLGLSADDIRTALRDGTTLSELAKKQGKSEGEVIKALVDAAKTQLDTAVKDGKLTQARADEIEKDLSTRITDFVQNGRPAKGPGMRGGPGGGFGGSEGQGRGEPGTTTPPTPTPGATGSSTSFEPAGTNV